MKTINTLTLILASIFILHLNAISSNITVGPASENNRIVLAPATPSEATFEENSLADYSFADISALAPVTPLEADFNDGVPAPDASRINLSPVTPNEADFNDAAPETTEDISILAPVTPLEAEFNDAAEMQADLSPLAPTTPAEADFE
jgi:hypothetical protein